MKIQEWKYDWEKQHLEMCRDFVFTNTFKTLEQYARTFEENGTKPEGEIYDSTMINNLTYMASKGYIKKTSLSPVCNGDTGWHTTFGKEHVILI